MRTIKIILSTCAALACFSSVYAEDFPQSSLPMTKLINNLESHGYPVVNKIDYSDNVYHVNAINNRGQDVKADVNPQSGKITKTSSDKETLTISDAAKKINQSGYHNIYYLESSGSKYKAKALDKTGHKVSLDVDGGSGKVTQ